MRRDGRTYLWDIKEAADAILRFLGEMDAQTFERSEIVTAAVERKFEIIGEALSQLAKLDPVLARRIPDMRDIIAFRNILIHGYAIIEHDQVWRIAKSSLPGLRVVVSELIEELGRSRT